MNNNWTDIFPILCAAGLVFGGIVLLLTIIFFISALLVWIVCLIGGLEFCWAWSLIPMALWLLLAIVAYRGKKKDDERI